MIVWNNQWEWKYESVWGFINKLEYANQINDVDLKSELPFIKDKKLLQDIKMFNFEKFMIDYDGIKTRLGIDVINKQKSSTTDILYPFTLESFLISDTKTFYKSHLWFKNELCFCPECMKMGYHSLFHQFIFSNNECFIHKIELKNCCPECGNPIPYGFSTDAKLPYACKCGHKLFDLPFEEAYNTWLKPTQIIENTKTTINIPVMAIIIPRYIYQHDILNKNLITTMSNICNNRNTKSNYYFNTQNNIIVTSCYDAQVILNTSSSNTDIDAVYWKAIQVAERHIRRSMKLKKINYIHNLPCTRLELYHYKKETIAYFLWIKYSEGVSYINLIHSFYMNQRRRNSYGLGRDEWLPKHIINELEHLRFLYNKYPNELKNFICHNIIYRLFILRLIKTYNLILEQIMLDYNTTKNVILSDYYNNFRNDLADHSSYILELNESTGRLWCIPNNDEKMLV